MPETKRPLKVFLCHARADKQKVRELYRYLRRRGIKPWFDEVDLVGGQDWQVEIPKALATSDAIVICLTKNSVDKEGYIQKEIKFALDKALEMPQGRIFLIPVRFEECEVPFSLGRYQWVDLFDRAGYARMMRALKFRASQLERATVELSKKDIEEEEFVLEKAAREKEEREAAEKAAREKEEREKEEKAAQEKLEREAAKKAAREIAEPETAAKLAQEKIEIETQHEPKKLIKGAKRELIWKRFPVNVRYRLVLLRPYFLPILLGLSGMALLIYEFYYMPGNIPAQNPNPTNGVTDTPTVTVTLIPSKTPTIISTVAEVLTLTPSTPFPRTSKIDYQVMEGDSLARIAKKFNVAMISIITENNIKDANALQVGQVLVIPAIPATYTLQWGEWLSCIAMRFNVDLSELPQFNGLAADSPIYPGQLIRIPQTGNPFIGDGSLQSYPAQYTVVSSDETISGIACMFGDVFPEDIASVNGLSFDSSLVAGQVLNMP